MSKKKIYIAGKVTGEDLAACTMKFGTAQKEIEALGFEAVNPLEVVGDWKATWKDAMRKCIKALMDCDAILLLPCYQISPGAQVERKIGYEIDIPRYTHIDFIIMAKENGEL